MKMKKMGVMLLAGALALTGCGGKTTASAPTETAGSAAADTAAAGIKVAAVLGGPITDKSWNETAYNGLMQIKDMGAETSYVESCAASDAPDAIRTFASEGYNVIYVNSSAFKDAAYEIAPQFPDVTFIINGSGPQGENYVSISASNHEQGFIQGLLCATMSKSGKVGMVCGTEMTPILDAEAGFYQGCQYVNDQLGRDVEYRATYLGNFEDTTTGYETALSFIAEGYDAMTMNADNASNTVLQACEEKGVYCAGNGSGQNEVAPTKMIAGVKLDNAATYVHSFQEYLDGTLFENAGKETYGVNFGVVSIDEFYEAANDYTDEERAFIDETIEKLANGEIEVKNMEDRWMRSRRRCIWIRSNCGFGICSIRAVKLPRDRS